MKQINRYIEYEVKINSLPLEIFGAFAGDGGEKEFSDKGNVREEDGYKVATEDDIDLFARFLSGGL